jgi:hypothetical protein
MFMGVVYLRLGVLSRRITRIHILVGLCSTDTILPVLREDAVQFALRGQFDALVAVAVEIVKAVGGGGVHVPSIPGTPALVKG